MRIDVAAASLNLSRCHKQNAECRRARAADSRGRRKNTQDKGIELRAGFWQPSKSDIHFAARIQSSKPNRAFSSTAFDRKCQQASGLCSDNEGMPIRHTHPRKNIPSPSETFLSSSSEALINCRLKKREISMRNLRCLRTGYSRVEPVSRSVTSRRTVFGRLGLYFTLMPRIKLDLTADELLALPHRTFGGPSLSDHPRRRNRRVVLRVLKRCSGKKCAA